MSVLSRLRNLWRERELRRELDEELRFHYEKRVASNRSRGLTPAEAASEARRHLGNLTNVREGMRDARVMRWLDAFSQDLRYAVRVLMKERWFTATAVLALAVGIASVTMMFTIINGYFLRSLPVKDGSRIVLLGVRDREGRPDELSPLEFQEWRAASRAVAPMAAYRATGMTVGDPGVAPDRVAGAYVTAGLFEMLGQQPILGRSVQVADDRPGAPRVVVLGHRLWTNRYDASREVVGRTIGVDGHPATVIGVMPEAFGFPFRETLWQPLAQLPGVADATRDDRWLNAIGRLADGVTTTQAGAELAAIAADVAVRHPLTNAGIEPTVERFGDHQHNRLRDAPEPQLGAMLAALLLVIACANVANLLLSRSAGRAREIALRAAIGASRSRIVRQLLMEATLLAGVAGVTGLWLSTFGVSFVRSLMGENLPYWMEFPIDLRVVAVLVLVCFATSLAAGLVPALLASKTDLSAVLRDDSRTARGGRVRRWTAALLIAESALTLVLLAASALVVRSFVAILGQDRVIDASRVLTTSVALPDGKYVSAGERQALYAALEQRLAATAGIGVATMASARPFAGGTRMAMHIEEREASDATRPIVTNAVGPRYFQALGLGALSGRTFTDSDGAPGLQVAIVNQLFADTYFANENALGRRLRLWVQDSDPAAAPWLTIVGVTPTVRQNVASGASPVVYTPFRQHAAATAHLVVGGLARPAAVTPALRRALAAVDPDVAIFNVRPLADLQTDSRLPQLLISTIFSIFAVGGLVLAVVGVYAVTAYTVRQRLHEIAVRLALGASPTKIAWLFMRRSAVTLAGGLAIGSIGAFAVGQLLRAMLVDVSPSDLLTFVAIVLLLSTVTLAASLIPSLWASRCNPYTLLRRE